MTITELNKNILILNKKDEDNAEPEEEELDEQEEKTKKGKQIITAAVVGLVVIALSNVIKAVIWDVVTAK